MNPAELQKHIDWLQQRDIRESLESSTIAAPWFPVFRAVRSVEQQVRWFSALVPPAAIPRLLQDDGWDIGPADGLPAVWVQYQNGEPETQTYSPYGNENGVEPLVIWRGFDGMRPDFLELAQEFRFYHNLYPEPARKRFIQIDANGDESEAARYGDDFMEVRTDLLRRFCAAKQMALAVYVESFRYSRLTLAELGISESRTHERGDYFHFPLAVVPEDIAREKKFETCGLVVGGKKYILPEPMPSDDDAKAEYYHEFIIGTDADGKAVRHTCDPGKLANYFGKNPEAPHFLTPVFFRPEVLAKYYAEPAKYSVEDGYLRCGALWGLRMDNDHADCVVVWLGDLGGDLSETERHYWLSFNIAPEGRGISGTNFKRAMLGLPTDPKRPDLVFKHEYERFNREFRDQTNSDFFLPLHADDEHFLTGLRLLAKDNQAEFDSQLLALTKVLVDSLNEKEIAKGLTTLAKDEKGISKVEKFFVEHGVKGFEPHIKFLRVLQDLRSKSAAHRKGSSYDKLIADLQLADEGQQKVFATLLTAAGQFITFLRATLLPKAKE